MIEELPKREHYQTTRTKPNLAIQKPESIVPPKESLSTPQAAGSYSVEGTRAKSSNKEKLKKVYSPGTDHEEVEVTVRGELQPEFPLLHCNAIDAKDKRNQWYTAKIVKQEKGLMLVHFDGWDPKEDIVSSNLKNRLSSKKMSLNIVNSEQSLVVRQYLNGPS